MLHKYYKKTKKGFKNNHVEDINIFLKKKKKKKKKRLNTDIKIFLKKNKQKVSIIMTKWVL